MPHGARRQAVPTGDHGADPLVRPPILRALERHNRVSGTPPAIKALAHITGGGLLENIPRVLPAHLAAHLSVGSWPQSELFAWLQRTAGIDAREMNRTFNNGIGMVLVIAPDHAQACADTLAARGERVYPIGRIGARAGGEAVTVA